MKRFCSILSALFVALCFSGCGDSASTTSANKKGGLTEQTPEFKEYMKQAGNKMGMRTNPNKTAPAKAK